MLLGEDGILGVTVVSCGSERTQTLLMADAKSTNKENTALQ